MRGGAVWRWAQALGLLATGALLAGLVWAPEPALRILWKVVIPLVPASLLLTPLLWRNVCPLATLNQLTGGPLGRRSQDGRLAAAAVVVGIALLAVLVPARRFLLNTDGSALAATIAGVGVLALGLGALFDARGGFCSGICPVLPVERLYGQSPLLRIGNVRCSPCTACARACIDLSPGRSVRQVAGVRDGGTAWLRTPFGVFAAAFPGFVLAYFTATDVPVAEAGAVYLRVLLFSAASWLTVASATRALRLSFQRVLPALGAIAAGLYYWFAAPDLAAAVGAEAAGGHLRAVALAFVAAWWVWAEREAGERVMTAPASAARRAAGPRKGER